MLHTRIADDTDTLKQIKGRDKHPPTQVRQSFQRQQLQHSKKKRERKDDISLISEKWMTRETFVKFAVNFVNIRNPNM